jgi:peptide/nickel transport system permease protein
MTDNLAADVAEVPPSTPGPRPREERRAWVPRTAAGRVNLELIGGAFIVAAWAVVAIISPLIAPYSPTAIDPNAISQAPSGAHWLGTDSLGSDILSRLLYAPRIDLTVAVCVTVLSVPAGTLIGIAIALRRGWADAIVMRVVDAVQAFPVVVAGLVAVGLLTRQSGVLKNTLVVIVVIAVAQMPTYIRLARSSAIVVVTLEYIEAARVGGAKQGRIVLRHVIPNCLGPIYTAASQNAGYAILLTAGLAFVGVGITPPTPEWGVMIQAGSNYLLTGAWWMSIPPGLAMATLILGFVLVGDGLQRHGERSIR